MKQLTTVTLGFLLAAACANEPVPSPSVPAAQTQPSALETSFAAAAREYQVPQSVLKGIAYVETRVSPTAGLVSQNGGHGLMALVERDDWRKLSRASELTGTPAARLKLEPADNVRGAAAVLRELFDETARTDASLQPHEVGDWYQAVSLYPGYDSAAGAYDYAADVFLRLEQGFSVRLPDGAVVLAPTASQWRERAPQQAARRDALNGSDYPEAVTFLPSPHNSSRSTYEFVVIHTMQGSYSGCKSWFQNPTSKVSANYLVRSSDGEITQMVRDSRAAWHAQCYNGRSIGIEHEGFIQDPGRWYTEKMYAESAKLTRWLTERYGIPRTRSRIIGHAEVASGCNTGGHTDPGSGWNWSKYMSLVNGSSVTPTSGVLTGAIYQQGDLANRVAGAVVTVGSQSVTTQADGMYQFTLSPGAYTVSVSKTGFGNNSVQRTVTAASTTWGSMELNATTATGILRGKVYIFNPSSPNDLSQSVSGATVSISPGGQTATTGADGNWLFTLAPGTYTVTATANGYANNSQTRTVVASGTAWGSVGLSPASGADVQPPQLSFTTPSDGASLSLGAIDVEGTASDDRGLITTVKLSLNGAPAIDVPVSGGNFKKSLTLKPGSNTLALSASDAAGNTGTASITVVFNAGVAGTVFQGEDESAKLSGITVDLLEAQSRVKVSTATTGADGRFVLPVMTVPADYILVAHASGFTTSSQTVTVPDDQQLVVDISLQAAGEVLDQGLAFTDPVDGATVNTESATIYGIVEGFELLGVKVNDVEAELLGHGGFAATIPLVEGDNAVTAVGTGLGGETVSATMHITRALANGKGPMNATGGCGCSSSAGFVWLLLGALPLIRRRRHG